MVRVLVGVKRVIDYAIKVSNKDHFRVQVGICSVTQLDVKCGQLITTLYKFMPIIVVFFSYLFNY